MERALRPNAEAPQATGQLDELMRKPLTDLPREPPRSRLQTAFWTVLNDLWDRLTLLVFERGLEPKPANWSTCVSTPHERPTRHRRGLGCAGFSPAGGRGDRRVRRLRLEKRRIVHQAAQYPFARVIGVEISDYLNGIASTNVERNRHRLRCPNIQLIPVDATAYARLTVALLDACHSHRRGCQQAWSVTANVTCSHPPELEVCGSARDDRVLSRELAQCLLVVCLDNRKAVRRLVGEDRSEHDHVATLEVRAPVSSVAAHDFPLRVGHGLSEVRARSKQTQGERGHGGTLRHRQIRTTRVLGGAAHFP